MLASAGQSSSEEWKDVVRDANVWLEGRSSDAVSTCFLFGGLKRGSFGVWEALSNCSQREIVFSRRQGTFRISAFVASSGGSRVLSSQAPFCTRKEIG